MTDFYFHKETPEEVRRILTQAYDDGAERTRLRIYLGDTKTGEDWCDPWNENTGYIGKSTGSKPIPLLIKNSRSTGGAAILDDCIIKIVDVRRKKLLYKHPKYHLPANDLGEKYTAHGVLKGTGTARLEEQFDHL